MLEHGRFRTESDLHNSFPLHTSIIESGRLGVHRRFLPRKRFFFEVGILAEVFDLLDF
jgi:hypothetical protein